MHATVPSLCPSPPIQPARQPSSPTDRPTDRLTDSLSEWNPEICEMMVKRIELQETWCRGPAAPHSLRSCGQCFIGMEQYIHVCMKYV